MKSLKTAADYRARIAALKLLYDNGDITREEAMRIAQPIINLINVRSAEVSRKHGRKPYRLDFISAMRNSY